MARLSKKKVTEILDLLREAYPEAGCALSHMDVFELAVCVVLSAQTTDVSVNKVTHGGTEVREEGQGLFDLYPDPQSLASAKQEDVMNVIRTIGMYKTKSKNIIALAKALCEKHDGKVPEDYDALVALPGVGRKTANVILAEGFGLQKIAVDTHVFRVSHRIGLASEETSGAAPSAKGTEAKAGSKGMSAGEDSNSNTSSKRSRKASPIRAKSAGEKNVLATEQELMKILPNDRWTEAHHSLIWHGRNCCTARNPKCGSCPIERHCQKNNVE